MPGSFAAVMRGQLHARFAHQYERWSRALSVPLVCAYWVFPTYKPGKSSYPCKLCGFTVSLPIFFNMLVRVVWTTSLRIRYPGSLLQIPWLLNSRKLHQFLLTSHLRAVILGSLSLDWWRNAWSGAAGIWALSWLAGRTFGPWSWPTPDWLGF